MERHMERFEALRLVQDNIDEVVEYLETLRNAIEPEFNRRDYSFEVGVDVVEIAMKRSIVYSVKAYDNQKQIKNTSDVLEAIKVEAPEYQGRVGMFHGAVRYPMSSFLGLEFLKDLKKANECNTLEVYVGDDRAGSHHLDAMNLHAGAWIGHKYLGEVSISCSKEESLEKGEIAKHLATYLTEHLKKQHGKELSRVYKLDYSNSVLKREGRETKVKPLSDEMFDAFKDVMNQKLSKDCC